MSCASPTSVTGVDWMFKWTKFDNERTWTSPSLPMRVALRSRELSCFKRRQMWEPRVGDPGIREDAQMVEPRQVC